MCVYVNSVTHLLGYFVWVENARHGHLQFVFLLLGQTQWGFPFLQEQVGGVLTRKFLKEHRETHEHVDLCGPPASCHLRHNPPCYNSLSTHTLCTPGDPFTFTQHLRITKGQNDSISLINKPSLITYGLRKQTLFKQPLLMSKPHFWFIKLVKKQSVSCSWN